MDSEPGRSLILWTVRVSVALYALAVWRSVFFRNPLAGSDQRYRWLWSLAWGMCVVHVLCAFHFQHRWNHAAALEHTASMTERVVGIHWAGGLYINYVFLLWWGRDVWQLWTRPQHQSGRTFHAVAAFMMLNATVVFGPAWWWLPVTTLLLAMIATHQTRKRSTPANETKK